MEISVIGNRKPVSFIKNNWAEFHQIDTECWAFNLNADVSAPRVSVQKCQEENGRTSWVQSQ
jgi:hypothetical protein